MAKNIKTSCLSNSGHIGIKFLWVANRMKQGKISFKHFPTDKMLEDLFTKSLQGIKFKLFRRVIMGWYDVAALLDDSDNKDKVS